MKPGFRAVSPSVTFFGLAFVLLYSSGDSSRARRRHPPSTDGWSPSVHTVREESSIPGVSIWTSKSVSTSRSDTIVFGKRKKSAGRVDATSNRHPGYHSLPFVLGKEHIPSAVFRNDQKEGWQGGLGDADVQPPSPGVREGQEGIDEHEDEYGGILTTEEEEDEQETGDAAPGRLLEEGGGSDSQEDDTDEDDRSEEEDHDEDNDRGDHQDDSDEQDSYDDGSADSPSDDDDSEDVPRSSLSRWGPGGLSRASRRSSQEEMGGDEHREHSSLRKMYEEDEEACFARVKQLWQEKIMPSLSSEEVRDMLEGIVADQKKLMEAAPTELNSRLPGDEDPDELWISGRAVGSGDVDGTGYANEGNKWEGEASPQRLLYRLLLAEMQGDGPSGGLSNRWIDRDALLQLRGAATLAHHPEYLQHTANLPRVSRGLRVVAPEATHSMQEALARSLSHSTGSKLVLLDNKVLDLVRGRALSDGVPKERLTPRHLTSALLELAREDGSPFVIFLKDKGSVVMKNRGMCQRVTEELKSRSSRVLFLLSTASDPSVPGNSGAAPGEDVSGQDGSPQPGVFGTPLQWPPAPRHMAPGQSKRNIQDGSQPKKNFIFLQQTPPDGGDGGGYFSGRSSRGGRGNSSGGRGPAGQGFGRGMPPGSPLPPHMLEQLFKEAMKNMHERAAESARSGGNNASGQDRNAGTSDQDDVNGGSPSGPMGGGGPDQLPPGLMEALGEALNDEEFKRTLEQIAKQMGKDMQGFSIMFSTTTAPPGGSRGQEDKEDEEEGIEEEDEEGEEENGTSFAPWGAANPTGNPSGNRGAAGGGGGGNWQGSGSSLSWLTNLRKGIMSGDEVREDGSANEEHGVADDIEGGSENKRRSGSGGGGSGDGGGSAEGRKGDLRRGVDMTPSGTEMRAFVSSFEDVVVNPPQDAVLRQHWDAWVKYDVGKHNTQQNRQALMTALRRNMLACPELKQLDPLLARHRLTEAETGQVVLSALKVELTKAAAAAVAAVAAAENASSARSGSSAALSEDERDGASSSPSLVLPLLTPRKTGKGRLVISRQSMETAFAAVCKAYVPRPGHPMSRTREEVTALAQHDRHEQALVTNVILPKDIGVTYDMIGGLGGAKELLRECITYPLRFPHLYNEGIAKEAVKGVLLFGPPGTGKTMLAKAVATEGGATFLSVDASVIENKWLGESEKNARAVFTLARRLAPCVIFIDEVDSVLSSREKYDDTTHGTLTSVKTTLMQEWDGLRTGGDRVVVIASTNRPFDLDEAVLRRLPRRILVDLPDAETREEILKVSMAQNRVDESVNFTAITQELEGFTGSDIKEVCREAVVRIAHEKAHELDTAGIGPEEEIDLTAKLRPVTMEDFWEARKKLTASVSEKGRELARVWEWNEEYGEVKKKRLDSSAQHLSMYL